MKDMGNISKCDPFFRSRMEGEVEQVRWVEIKERQQGGVKNERGGGSETGGLQASSCWLALFLRPAPFNAGKENTVLFSEEHFLLFFFLPLSRLCAQSMVSSPRVLKNNFSPLYFFWRPWIVGRMLLSPGTYLSVSACLSHNSICVWRCLCLCVGMCVYVCVSYHLQVNLQITGLVCLSCVSVSLSACVWVFACVVLCMLCVYECVF